jgi:ABC-type dipeptide/oligopeptide/nickel transport system, ATPase component
MAQPTLIVNALNISFDDVSVVNGISFSLNKGKTLAIVGESGSGKSITALAIMGLLPATAKLQ